MFTTPEQVLKTWLCGVNSGATQQVVSLYSEQAVLLATFSNKRRCGLDDVTQYFEQFANYQDLNVRLHDNTLSVVHLADSIYCIDGAYCWRYTLASGAQDCEARFTFVIDTSLARPIIHQHSSRLP